MATVPVQPWRRSGAVAGLGPITGLAAALAWCVLAGRAGAEGADGGYRRAGLPGSGSSLMGNPPGSGGSVFSNLPGEGGVLSGRPGPTTPKGVPATVTRPGTGPSPTALQEAIEAPMPQPVGAMPGPTYGTLTIPSSEPTLEDNPPDGMGLEQIIDVTLQRSLDLRSKYYEIPMARADVLQAGLRANPIFYQDGQLLQYRPGEYNRSRPGGPQQFDTNVTIPLDVSRKRLARVEVTTRAQKVLEALFQESVRQRIDDVYDAYVAALSARQTARYARASVEGLEKLASEVEQLFKSGSAGRIDLIKVRNQLRTTQLRLIHAQADYRKALLDLGALMNLSSEEVDRLKIKGSILVEAPPTPTLEDLKGVALAERPDVVAYRLGIQRAQADVRLARANAYSDVYVLWQPYTFQDNSPYGVKSATSWALGVTVPLPIFNRNQGGIERAKINVMQSHVQLADVERQAQVDVAKALQDVEVNRREVEELREHVVPDARSALEDVLNLLRRGERSYSDYLNAQLDFNDIVEQYRDTAIRYRRSLLAINTATGKRVMP